MKFNPSIKLLLAALGGVMLCGCQSNTVYFAPEPRRGIEYVPTTGGNPKILVPEVTMLMGLACAADGQKLYVAQQSAINCWDGGKWITISTPKTANCVALDKKAGRLYWGDMGLNQIASCDLQGGDLTVLVSGIQYPNSIAVNPKRGLLYWVQEAPERGVWMARLNGKGRHQISDEGILPAALAVDPGSGRVFWARPESGGSPTQIIAANFDGSDSRVIVSAENRFIDGLAVDEASRRLIWIERTGNDQTHPAPARIQSARFDGTKVKTIYKFEGESHARSVTIGPPRK